MDSWPISPADLLVLILVVASAVIAFARGFVREVLSVLAWIGAGLFAFFAFSSLSFLLREYIGPPMLADVLTGAALFIVALVVFSILANMAVSGIRGSSLGGVDRSLGFLFGLLRGAALACLGYLAVLYFQPGDEPPGWIAEARAAPLLREGGAWIASLIPGDAGDGLETLRRRATPAVARSEALERMSRPEPASPDPAAAPGPTGYSDRQRGELERMIDTAQ